MLPWRGWSLWKTKCGRTSNRTRPVNKTASLWGEEAAGSLIQEAWQSTATGQVGLVWVTLRLFSVRMRGWFPRDRMLFCCDPAWGEDRSVTCKDEDICMLAAGSWFGSWRSGFVFLRVRGTLWPCCKNTCVDCCGSCCRWLADLGADRAVFPDLGKTRIVRVQILSRMPPFCRILRRSGRSENPSLADK